MSQPDNMLPEKADMMQTNELPDDKELETRIKVYKEVLEHIISDLSGWIKSTEEAREAAKKAREARDRSVQKNGVKQLYYELPPPKDCNRGIYYWLDKELRKLGENGVIGEPVIQVLENKVAYTLSLLNHRAEKEVERKFDWARKKVAESESQSTTQSC